MRYGLFFQGKSLYAETTIEGSSNGINYPNILVDSGATQTCFDQNDLKSTKAKPAGYYQGVNTFGGNRMSMPVYNVKIILGTNQGLNQQERIRKFNVEKKDFPVLGTGETACFTAQAQTVQM